MENRNEPEEIVITFFDHEYNSWERDVEFEWRGTKQRVIVRYDLNEGWDTLNEKLTEEFREWLEENELDLAHFIDDLTWDLVKVEVIKPYENK